MRLSSLLIRNAEQTTAQPRVALSRLRLLLPEGRTLPDDAWRRRHHAMVLLLVGESVGLVLFSLAQGNSWLHSLAHAAALLPIAVLALLVEHRRRAASVLVSLGLITACALLVHIWHGAIEGHFLFFVTIVVLALYEDWLPFLVAAAYVVIHHGVMGALDAGGVYNHPDAIAHPWKWAVIHGAFVIAAGMASVAAWRLNETVRAQAQESYRRARESEDRFRAAFEGAPIGMILFDYDMELGGGITQVNRAMCEITGHTSEHLCSNSLRDVVHPDDAEVSRAAVERLANGEEERPQVELRYIHADGHTVWVSVSLSLLGSDSGETGHAIAQVEDASERKLALEELAYQALHDSLTGLGNRRSLLRDLKRRLAGASADRPLLLQLFDLDGFKSYNDTFGHPAGDALLTRMAGRLESALDGSATAYRMGGDEFCVLSLPSCAEHDAIAQLACEALTEHGESFDVTATYGSVTLPADATTPTEALRKADRRMYAGKSANSRSSAGRQSADVLLSILSERSPALGTHLDEVATLCEAVAARLGVPEQERAPLLQAASLHDVGKVAVPDEILNKPAALDDDELAFMRRHTLIGERILLAAPALSRASKLVRWSHERFDGTGYPDGLAGEEIPLGSRIIAVCDAFDAMVSDRPYRKALEPEEARAELRRCAGGQFDPVAVEVFCELQVARERTSAEAMEVG
jgi:diguanylate cyclase (GGDEF)-like protein/PAS domain S-box-containing protein